MLGGFSQVSMLNEPGAFTNWAVDELATKGNDIKQFGQLLATLLGHCNGSGEYTRVNNTFYNHFQWRDTVKELHIHITLKMDSVRLPKTLFEAFL